MMAWDEELSWDDISGVFKASTIYEVNWSGSIREIPVISWVSIELAQVTVLIIETRKEAYRISIVKF